MAGRGPQSLFRCLKVTASLSARIIFKAIWVEITVLKHQRCWCCSKDRVSSLTPRAYNTLNQIVQHLTQLTANTHTHEHTGLLTEWLFLSLRGGLCSPLHFSDLGFSKNLCVDQQHFLLPIRFFSFLINVSHEVEGSSYTRTDMKDSPCTLQAAHPANHNEYHSFWVSTRVRDYFIPTEVR